MRLYDKKIGKLVNKLKLVLFGENTPKLVLFMVNHKLVLLWTNKQKVVLILKDIDEIKVVGHYPKIEIIQIK